jgi:hypothetical protein
MSEINKASLDKGQKKSDPQIEEEILELFNSDMKETALEFISYLRANKMTPQQWFGPNYWRIPYENNYLGGIVVNKDRWRFWFFSGDYSGEFRDDFVQVIQDNVRHCVSCVDDCPKGKGTTVFGKEFTNVCFQFPIQFENPNSSILEYIKELIEYWKEVAPHSDSWHCR